MQRRFACVAVRRSPSWLGSWRLHHGSTKIIHVTPKPGVKGARHRERSEAIVRP
jgi:hypothetical protein